MKRIYTNMLPASFYVHKTLHVAQALLGKILVHQTEDAITAGRIVETEAYLCKDDPACHAARGKTQRNAPMFGPAGTAYIYLIYGIHYCFNVVTGKVDEGEAVLIRALEPVSGLKQMKERRHIHHERKLCSGPGNLCRALAITPAYNGHHLTELPLYLADDGFIAREIITAPRVGITLAADLPLRFYIKDSPYVSRK